MTHDGDDVAVWLLDAGDLMVNGLPCHRVIIDECVKTRARSRFSGRCDTRCFQNPTIILLFMMSKTFTVRAFGVKNPGPKFSCQRVPADSLSSTHGFFATDDNREFSHQEVAVVHGFT